MHCGKSAHSITSSACAGDARIGYLDDGPAEFLDARVEELARIVASNAPIAVRGMKRELNEIARNRFDEAAADRRHRGNLHGNTVREGSHADKRPPLFEARATFPGSQQRLPASEIETYAAAERPTVLPIRILHLRPTAHLHLSPHDQVPRCASKGPSRGRKRLEFGF
jgi:hypothetical protein